MDSCNPGGRIFDIALALRRGIDQCRTSRPDNCQTDLVNMSAADLSENASKRPANDSLAKMGQEKKVFTLPRGAPHPTPENACGGGGATVAKNSELSGKTYVAW